MIMDMMNRMRKSIVGAAFFLAAMAAGRTVAQARTDTLELNLQQAEKLFLERNLSLVSAKYDIDINKALTQQARYWDNPTIYISTNVYDGKFFRHGVENGNNYGQWYVQLEQVVKTAGKRGKLIKLAEDATLTSEQQFTRQMQNLRFLLATDLNSLHQVQETKQLYALQRESLGNMTKAMDAQLQEGNISRKDNLRIKALLFGLESDAADLRKQEADIQSDLRILLRMGTDTVFRAVPETVDPLAVTAPKLGDLVDSALKNRPDIHIAQINLESQGHNLAYQKALAVPDLTVEAEYDQNSTYIRNYYGMGLGIPIPVLNRNKGNIKAAEIGRKQAQTGLDMAREQVVQDVAAAFAKWNASAEAVRNFRGQLGDEYDQLVRNMAESYKARQVTLIEFTDFFQSYTDTRLKQLAQEAGLRNAAAEIAFTTGTPWPDQP
jgi:outer membrane protein, heavy metal efflux system